MKTIFRFYISAILVAIAIGISSCKKENTDIEIHTLSFAQYRQTGSSTAIFDFADDMHGLMIYYGGVAITTDGGYSWQETQFLNGYTANSLSYPVIDTGYVFMHPPTDNVHCYRIRGQGWIMEDVNSFGLMAVPAFCSATTGLLYARRPPGMYCLMRTVDGGENWITVDSTINFEAIRMNSPSFAYATGNFTFYYTNDGGYNWTPSATNCRFFSRIDENGIGYYGDGNSTLYKTSDFGVSWNAIWTDPAGFRMYSMDVGPDGLIVVSGDDHLLVSSDHGITWAYYNVIVPTNYGSCSYYRVHIANTKQFFVTGENENNVRFWACLKLQ